MLIWNIRTFMKFYVYILLVFLFNNLLIVLEPG
jgi:hypothetical protein